jgi:hypothetical protein
MAQLFQQSLDDSQIFSNQSETNKVYDNSIML